MNKISLIFIFLLLSACSSDKALINQVKDKFSYKEQNIINLSDIGSSSWQRLCILKPYTTNKQAKKILGFYWDAESKTSISSNDTVNVLVFLNRQTVEGYIEYPRNKGDFANLTPNCMTRNKAQVRIKKENGWIAVTAIK